MTIRACLPNHQEVGLDRNVEETNREEAKLVNNRKLMLGTITKEI